MKDERYLRQTILSEIGEEGQHKIEQVAVAIVGIGALGTVAAELLTRAGAGKLILIDRDVIEESNLQRQTLYEEKDVGRSKVVVAKERLQKINSKLEMEIHAIHLNAGNIEILRNANLILDCTDNLQTRFLINDFCRKEKIPWIYGAAIKTAGYAMSILPSGPCLRCFLQEASLETCETAGVLNTITTSIAALQVTLALQIVVGKEVEQDLHHLNIWNFELKRIKVLKNKDCPACKEKYEYLEKKEETRLVKFCSSGRYQINGKKIDLSDIKRRWEKIDRVVDDKVLLSFKNILLFEDGRALIKASSEEEALSVYSKWVGN
ncbi:MAG: ThiF family adenylyltransferase [Nanoarchaeota archaeon]|nr:ThiF family adenylyltransferase [Nanoarchaeota archaeon]